jgi:hypothetical protein
MPDDFDPVRYRIATDALCEAGFDDVAEWVRRKIEEQACCPVVFGGVRLDEMARELRHDTELPPTYRTMANIGFAAYLMDWLRGDSSVETLSAIPMMSGGSTWRHIEIGPDIKGLETIRILCPVCTPNRLGLWSFHDPVVDRSVLAMFEMDRIRIAISNSSAASPALHVGQCRGCRNWFAG